jgi:uncharacterized protein
VRFPKLAWVSAAILLACVVAHADELPTASQQAFAKKLAAAAIERTGHAVVYDPAYVKLDYPGGDVPAGHGVCTDVVIRAYRALGVDLQQLVHEDMAAHFGAYPKTWGLTAPDSNIDHRRVPNLRVFFKRHGNSLPVPKSSADWRPGDLVTWRLDSGVPHIGIVTDRMSPDGARPLVAHNIGAGPQLEDVLPSWEITGRFVFFGPNTARHGR